MKKPDKPKKPEAPRAHPGDHVFFHHDDGPLSGHVVCCGKHGATVKTGDGQHHKVHWHKIMGHKKRADRQVTVIDQGEDGAICEDETGKRFYLRGHGHEDSPADDPVGHDDAGAEQEGDDMKKAMFIFTNRQGHAALRKAIAGAAGLALRDTTDKAGHQTKRWMKVAPDQKKGRQPAAGDDPHHEARQQVIGKVVPFTAGSFKGKGEVVAAGKDGVTVKDEQGREHQVHWHELHAGDGEQGDQKPGGEQQEAGKAEPEQQQEGAPATGGGHGGSPWGGKPLFDEKDMALPKDAAQPWDSEEAIYQNADEAHAHFTSWLKGVSEGLGIEHVQKKMDEVDWDNEKGGMLFIAPLKGRERANEKVNTPVDKDGYGGDWTKLLDVVRGTIAVDNLADIQKVVGKLKETGMELARAPKDRFTKPTPVGYRDVMLNVKMPNGMVAELQVNVKSMLKAKEDGHKPYEVMRSILAKEDRTEADDKAYQQAWDDSLKIYGDAWRGVAGGAGPDGDGQSTMQKSHSGAIILVYGKRRKANG